MLQVLRNKELPTATTSIVTAPLTWSKVSDFGKAVQRAWSRDPHSVELEWSADGPMTTIRAGERIVADRAWLRHEAQRWRGLASATLTVPIGICLVRDLQIPRSAIAHADDVLRFDLEATTPFLAKDTLSAWYRPAPDEAGDTVGVRQLVLRRDAVAAALADVSAAGLPLQAVRVVDEHGEALPINLAGAEERCRATAIGATTRILAMAAAIAVASSAVAFGLAVTRAENRLAAVTALAKTAAGEAAAVRREFTDAETRSAQMRQPRQRMAETVPLVVIWDEVTKTLPTATWINDLRLEDSGVQIDGQSPNASELLAALSRSSVFSGAAFVSPVTRDPQRGVERFQIRMQVSRGK